MSAVLVDDLHILRNDGRRTVEHDGETGDALFDLLEDVETERRRHKNTVCVARALIRREFERAVRGADRDCERVNARLFDEVLHFLWLRIGCVLGGDIDIVLNARKLTEFCFNDNTMRVCVFGDALCQCNIFGVRQVRAVDHDGREAAVDAGFADIEVCAVIEVQSDGDIIDFESCLDEMNQILMARIFACTCGDLQDQRGLELSRSIGNALNDLHVVDVESTDSVAAFIGFLKHFFCSDKWHVITPYKS